jgi:DNA polymerase III delta prime subunit
MRDVNGLALKLADHAKREGLYYPDDLLRGIEAALGIPRRFVIFYGPPGVGKTRLVQLVARSLEAELCVAPVQASWQDAAALIGFYDTARGTFLPGDLTSLAVRAAADPERFYAICLDELSLGKPDGYLATILAGLDENPPRLHLGIHAGNGEVPLPDNLLLFGTLFAEPGKHVDLPRKLLDRSLLIELEFPNLPRFLAARDAPFPGKEPLLAVCELLQGHGLVIGYRIFREIGAALTSAARVGLTPDQLLDQQMKSRILPAIRGDAAMVEGGLRELVKYLSEEELRFPETLDKAIRMLESLGERGDTAAYYS